MLKKFEEFDISKWSYINETVSGNKEIKKDVFHIGVMAQDFYKTFGLGTDEKLITTLDIGGVDMAAIKGLIEQNKLLSERIAKLEKIIQELIEKK